MKLEVTLTREEVQNIIREHLQTKFKKVDVVLIEVATKYTESYFGNGYYDAVFKGAKCTVEI